MEDAKDFKILAKQLLNDSCQREYNRLYRFDFTDGDKLYFCINDIPYLSAQLIENLYYSDKNTNISISAITDPKYGHVIDKKINPKAISRIIKQLRSMQLRYQGAFTRDRFDIDKSEDIEYIVNKINSLKTQNDSIEDNYSKIVY